jgi:outer membrane protein assembly factor BamB
MRSLYLLILIVASWIPARGADWPGFRGPRGLGIALDCNLPAVWNSKSNLAWKTELPGPGASSPIVVGDRVFVTCYSGYGLSKDAAGDMSKLKRHVLSVDVASGKTLWTREITPVLPEVKFDGYNALHGYASSTPVSDGNHVFAFFGKSGVFCFDLDGKQIWQASVGKGTDGFGAGPSPILYKDYLIVNASMESRALIALNKSDGKQVWSAKIGRTWGTPLLVTVAGRDELILAMPEFVRAFNPNNGDERWRCGGVQQMNYVCPSPVAHKGTVYAMFNQGLLAIRAGGNGDVTETHLVWSLKKGANVTSPVYHDGHVYFSTGDAGQVHCVTADKGTTVYQKPLSKSRDRIYASPLIADNKLYYTTREEGTYVLDASPKFRLLAHNIFEDDQSVCNGSLAAAGGRLFLRSNRFLYGIATKSN